MCAAVWRGVLESLRSKMNVKERPNRGVYIQVLRRMTSEDRLIKAGRMTEAGLVKVKEA